MSMELTLQLARYEVQSREDVARQSPYRSLTKEVDPESSSNPPIQERVYLLISVSCRFVDNTATW
jgi:hypothetical protein